MLVKTYINELYRNFLLQLLTQRYHRRQQDDLSCSVVDSCTSSSSTLEFELSKSSPDLLDLAANRRAFLSDVCSGSYLAVPIVSRRYSIASSGRNRKCTGAYAYTAIHTHGHVLIFIASVYQHTDNTVTAHQYLWTLSLMS